jgi:phage terminase large subunit-like protein
MFAPDDWQKAVLDSWLSVDDEGLWAASRCGLLVPRQNGKNALLEMRELYGLVVIGERILHTAHQQKTARKSFQNLVACFEQKELRGLVREVYSALGREGVYLKNGGSIEYVARTRSSARGYTVDVLVCDEDQYLSDEQYEALIPTISAAPLRNPQTIMVGTPPVSDIEAEVFSRMRKDAIEGRTDGLSWFEWSAGEIGDVFDRTRWRATNPALGTRLSERVVADEAASMSKEGFARERLGWWPEASSTALIAPHEWERLAVKKPPASKRIAYGVKLSPNGSTVALAVASRTDKVHVEIIEYRGTHEGIAWLVSWLSSRWRGASVIAIDGASGASLLAGALLQSKVPQKVVHVAKYPDVIASSSLFLNAVREKTLTHFDQAALNSAALCATKRPIGKSGGFGFGGDVDVTPLEAVALAHWGVMTAKRDPTRKQRLL